VSVAVSVGACVSVWVCVRMYVRRDSVLPRSLSMGWLRLAGSLELLVSFAEYHLCNRALLQKRPGILRSLLIVATPYHPLDPSCQYVCVGVCVGICVRVCACVCACVRARMCACVCLCMCV